MEKVPSWGWGPWLLVPHCQGAIPGPPGRRPSLMGQCPGAGRVLGLIPGSAPLVDPLT